MAASKQLVFKRLRGSIHHDVDGEMRLKVLEYGEEIPAGADEKELERLKSLDAVGSQEELAAEEAERERKLNEQPLDPELTPIEEIPDLDLTRLGSYSEPELATLWKARPPKVKDVVAHVGEDADLARKALAAEETATSGDVRSTMRKALEKLIGGDGTE